MLAGEKIDEGGTYRCQKCGKVVRVARAERIPKCADCGHDLFDSVES